MLGFLLTVSLALSGLIAGMWGGGTFLVDKNAGLAGAAEVFWYGLLGALLAGCAGFVLARRLGDRYLGFATLLLGPVGLAVLVLIIRAYSAAQRETQAHLEAAYNRLPGFHAILEHRGGPGFDRIEINWSARQYILTTGDRTCTSQLSGRDAVAILENLRAVDLVLSEHAGACGATAADYSLSYQINDTKPPVAQGRAEFGQDCLAQFPALEKAFVVAREIVRDGDLPENCR